MNPALLKLIFMQTRGFFRRSFRGSGLGRVAFFAVGAALIGLWLLANVINAVAQRRSEPARVRMIAPLAILGFCLVTLITSAGDRAIAFTAGEVDQLFPGPFTRRQLLFYKLLKSTLLAGLTAMILSLVMLRHAQWWFACFVGTYLAVVFVMYFNIAAVMVGQTIGVAAYSRARKFIVALVIIAVFAAGKMFVGSGTTNYSAIELAQQIHASPVGRVVLAPLEPFGNAITATRASELFKWAAYAAFLLVIVLAIVVVLDANYLEAAMAASQRRYEKIRKIRGGSFLSGVGLGKQPRRHLPVFPWLGGAGPIAWRQLTNAMRSSRGLLLLLGSLALLMLAIYRLIPHNPKELLNVGVGAMLWLTFLLSGMLNFDFRGDVDQMDVLKALPINSVALTLGQLVSPVLVMSMIHIAVLLAMGTIIHNYSAIALAAALILPINLLLFCAENLVFLLFPHRPAAASPGDLQILGRKFVFLLMKGLVLMIGALIAGCFAALAWVFTGKSLVVVGAVAWIALAVECAALVPAIAWAYRRFDPSVDTPA